MELLNMAGNLGFDCARIDTADIVIDPGFRQYCAENLCGQYGANYSCPPDCGSVEEMSRRLMSFDKALVLHSVWPIDSYQDYETIRAAKRSHNESMLMLCDILRREGTDCLMCGASHCTLCEECARGRGEPCRDPERRFSCLSAYCIHVAKLAEKAGIDFSWSDKQLNLYGLIAYG